VEEDRSVPVGKRIFPGNTIVMTWLVFHIMDARALFLLNSHFSVPENIHNPSQNLSHNFLGGGSSVRPKVYRNTMYMLKLKIKFLCLLTLVRVRRQKKLRMKLG